MMLGSDASDESLWKLKQSRSDCKGIKGIAIKGIALSHFTLHLACQVAIVFGSLVPKSGLLTSMETTVLRC
jgi:hypothetical protein